MSADVHSLGPCPTEVRHHTFAFADRNKLIALYRRISFGCAAWPMDCYVCGPSFPQAIMKARIAARIVTRLAQHRLRLSSPAVANQHPRADATTAHNSPGSIGRLKRRLITS